MDSDGSGELSMLLAAVRNGEPAAHDRLVNAIYQELSRMAGRMMKGERPDHTLQPSALVHEAIVRLLEGQMLVQAPNRRYLFGAASKAMRHVLVDHARRRQATKRSGQRIRVPLDETLAAFDQQGVDVLNLNEALSELARSHSRPAQVVELRFFGGMTVPEVAEALSLSTTAIESDWRFARAWLRGRLGDAPE